jgi:DNA ligase-1
MLAVAPEIVIEIAFDVIQKSTLHQSGFSLRFPRIVRIRLDKRASDANTLGDVENVYRAMLDREGVDV